MALFHLIHLSTAAPDISEDTLRDISRVSWRNNDRNDVTGALFFGSGRFLGYLEGPDEAVNQTYTRIRRDARHHNIECLYYGTLPERLYKTWNIGVLNLVFEPCELDMNEFQNAISEFEREHSGPKGYQRLVHLIDTFQSAVTAKSVKL